jgi:hypothetical protein
MIDRNITVDPELLELMPHVVTYERNTGVDEFGQPTYASPVLVRARVEGRMRRTMGADGIERVSSITIYLSTSPGISPADRITLPEGFNPRQPTIIGIERQSDQHGPYYEAIYS